MAQVVYNRVQETTATTGTGAITLAGAVAGYQSFAVVGNGNTTFYTITSGLLWEVGIGTYSTTGPTLTRTTVLSNSSGNTSPITLTGTSSVFVDYPAENAVWQGGPLGTPLSATLTNATGLPLTTGVTGTLATGNGGTGVTTSTGANSNVLRDANVNINANNFIAGYNVITAAGTTTVLTNASAYYQRISGSTTQTVQLPVGTTMSLGQGFTFDNDSSGVVTIVDNASAVIDTIPAGGYGYIFAEDITTSAGSWGKYALLPATYDFSTTTANFGAATITNVTYNGGTIGTAYGGTGLTTFTAANNALYSTSAGALVAGTLPTAAGGTGVATTPTNGQILVGNGTNYTVATVGTGTGISTTTGAGTLTINNTGVTSIVAGTGITVSGATGAVTVNSTGVTLTLATTQNTTSGTFIDFTSIPSTVKKITIMLNNVSTNGSSSPIIQVGAGSITSTGYTGGMTYSGGGAANSTGFYISASSASDSRYAMYTLVTMGSNVWCFAGVMYIAGPGIPAQSSGIVTLGGALDRVRLTTVGGTDTFDLGSINIMYE